VEEVGGPVYNVKVLFPRQGYTGKRVRAEAWKWKGKGVEPVRELVDRVLKKQYRNRLHTKRQGARQPSRKKGWKVFPPGEGRNRFYTPAYGSRGPKSRLPAGRGKRHYGSILREKIRRLAPESKLTSERIRDESGDSFDYRSATVGSNLDLGRRCRKLQQKSLSNSKSNLA